MTFCEVLELHFADVVMKPFARSSEPHIHYDFDEGDGPMFWAVNHKTDEMEQHSFTGAQIMATDWEI